MKKFLSTAILLLSLAKANANNVQVSNAFINGQNAAQDYSMINFNIAWDHSWRTATNEANYDGAWVFVKFRKANSGLWQHATINYTAPGNAAASGHTEPAGSTITTAPDGKGVFVYRNANGSGNVVFNGTALRWNYGVDGVLDNDSVEIRVYAVEMVYVTQGAFYLGSGGSESYFFKTGTTGNPYLVTSDSAITIGSAAGNLNYSVGGSAGDGAGPLPLAYPKGYNAFWMMKYECSEQQYADFLNSLDAARATTRNIGIPGAANNYIPTYPERAVGGMSGVDFLAMLDWMALRPMTELEYEKACRGYNITPLPNEYAWGNTTISYVPSVISTGTANETQTSGNANYYPFTTNISRPIRCGAFAQDTTTTRTQTGGGYYGALELSGNIQELCVTAGNAQGRAFTGTHGDGSLDANGEANVATWSALGIGGRGGSYLESSSNARVSDRTNATNIPNTGRTSTQGGRGVRTVQ